MSRTRIDLPRTAVRSAIVTRMIAPTNFRPTRIVAESSARKMTLSWDHGNNPEENHIKAAQEYAKRMQWEYGPLVSGILPNGAYVHVVVMEW